MHKILKLEEVNFVTNLKLEEILIITELYIIEKGESYDIKKENILYDKKSYITNEAVWYVDIISNKIRKKWPDAYISLAISDKEGRVVYVQNDHGVVIEKF